MNRPARDYILIHLKCTPLLNITFMFLQNVEEENNAIHQASQEKHFVKNMLFEKKNLR